MILNLPSIPQFKQYSGKITPEIKALIKLQKGESITEAESAGLRECITFYETCFQALKSLDLSLIDSQSEIELKEYLRHAISIIIPVINEIEFYNLFRVTIVRDRYLEGNKIRDTKYLTYPTLALNRQLGLYNRANTPNSTVLYAAFYEKVAIMETKPNIGDRIIISHWHNKSGEKFNSYPVPNIETINNQSLLKAAAAFQKSKPQIHPLLFEILDKLTRFVSEQYTKPVNCISAKRYEYIYSAHFSDQILRDEIPKNWVFTDCIIYPSVAYNHIHENLAIHPKSVEKLQIVNATEILVTSTNYENVRDLNDRPIEGKITRSSTQINNDKILWNDDK